MYHGPNNERFFMFPNQNSVGISLPSETCNLFAPPHPPWCGHNVPSQLPALQHGAALCGGRRKWLPAMSNSCEYIWQEAAYCGKVEGFQLRYGRWVNRDSPLKWRVFFTMSGILVVNCFVQNCTRRLAYLVKVSFTESKIRGLDIRSLLLQAKDCRFSCLIMQSWTVCLLL